MLRYHIALSLVGCLIGALAEEAGAQVVNSEWNVGNGDWNVPTNWFPNAAPDNGGGFTYNVTIGNRVVAAGAGVTFVPTSGTSDTVSTLTMTNSGNPLVSGADLFTNGNQLIVLGQTTINGSGSTIRVDDHNTPGTEALITNDLDLNNGGGLTMEGGIATINVLFEINTGTLGGHGTVNVGDNDLVVEKAFENSSLIQPSSNNAAPQTLTIHANGVDTIDLDGDSETGLVDVDNQLANVNGDTVTLVIDGPLFDPFSGTLQIGQRDTVTFNDDFAIASANVDFDGGNNVATLNGPADITSITTSAFTLAGSAVISNDMAFSGTLNTFTTAASSTLTLSGTVTVPDASMFVFGSNTTFIVSGSTNITEVTGDINLDGSNENVTTTVQGTGLLTISVDQFDSNGTDAFNGTLNLNDNGDLSVSVTAADWQMAGTLNKNGVGTSNITGDRMLVTSAGNIVVNAGTLDTPAITLQAGSDVTVNGTLVLGGGAELAGPATLTGTGTLRMEASSTVTASTTVNVSTFDWDGNAVGGTHTINAGVTFTINSANFDADGDMDDVFSLAGAGSQLVVNGPTQWTANGTITANAAAAGTATIGGTSRMVLAATMNVDGNTTISAPLTFAAGSIASIDSLMTLDANGLTTYAGGSITGLGTYDPASANTVTANSLINSTNFNFDAGNWTVQNNALLTVNVGDYDPDNVTNAFDATITLNNGGVSVNTTDAEFVMDNVINMNPTGGNGAEWSGEPLDIGNDAGALDADINVTGDGNPNSQGRFFSQIDFNSDADVNVAAGASLVFNGVVVFDTVNGGNNAEFTGVGTMAFNNAADLHEAVTLNMVGGTVDLDGNDATGEFINIDAPLVINAATMSSFGRVNGGGGVNTLDINNNVGTGSLSVNLDNAGASWTLNTAGTMLLVNDLANATLLSGNRAVLNGTVNVTGEVTTDAPITVGGVMTLQTAAEPFHLNGGNGLDTFNLMTGGTINGPGILAATTGHVLLGSGTINASIDFDGTAGLRADNGMLTINGAIVDAGSIGTYDVDGILNVVNAWNTSITDFVILHGGELKGGAITVANANGIQGDGLVSARVINNTRLRADTGTLVVETAANDNDWDGAGNTGLLSGAIGTLELRDNATFGFTGTVSVDSGSRVFANGFALDFNPGSTLSLQHGTYESTSSTDLGGAVTVVAGSDSTIKVANNFFLTFETGSATTLNANLRLENNNINVEAGATFSGTGALVIPDGSHLVGDNGANINVLLDNEGSFRPGNFEGIGLVNIKDYQQTNTGKLYVEIKGTLLNQFDRLAVSGIAQLDGYLNVDIDEVSPGVPFVPVLGNLFNIISAPGGVVGTFDYVDISGFPVGLTVHVNYLPTIVQLQVVAKPLFSADFDDDGDVDATDLSIWKAAFNLNQLGDADGDNDSDGADFLLWQQQLGSHPAVAAGGAVPEPTTAGMLAIAGAAVAVAARRSRRAA